MSNFYYLMSSLPELNFESLKSQIKINDFMAFCTEELGAPDLDALKKVFIFNDIKNIIQHKDEKSEYLSPSFYLEEYFQENLTDTDAFFSFIGEYFYYHKNEKKLYPKLLDIDEIVTLFYEHIDEFCEGFLKEYFLFELDLHNVSTALGQRQQQVDAPDKIIPFGDESKALVKSTSPDCGLARQIYFIEELAEYFKEGDLIKIEKKIEEIRWKWLDDQLGFSWFSLQAVQVYGIKLLGIDRWESLTEEKGKECIDLLIEEISASVQFKEVY